jgi:hypothetical protein
MEVLIQELLELAESEGLTLPYDPAFIAMMDRAGHVVDLETGEIL